MSISDGHHPLIKKNDLAPNVELTSLISESNRLISRFNQGIVGSERLNKDEIHIPLIIIMDRSHQKLPNARSNIISPEEIKSIIAPEDVLPDVVSLIQKNTHYPIPFSYFQLPENSTHSPYDRWSRNLVVSKNLQKQNYRFYKSSNRIAPK